jgi:flagellar motor switch protein FliG
MTLATSREGIRKAAILVASLDQRGADLLLEQMDERQARAVRDALVDLDEIDPAEQQRVIEEFFRFGSLLPGKCPSGIELDDRLAKRFLQPEPEPVNWSEPSSQTPFHFLRDAEADKLAKILVAERPQTIALVLSHLPPEQSGDVLARLAPALQVDVIRRLVDLEETDPEILREVERGLQTRFSEQVQMQRRRVAGLSAVSGILDASRQTAGMQILKNLSNFDRGLADRLGPQRFEFTDLLRLSNTALASVIDASDPEWIVLALVGAPPEWVDHFLVHYSEPDGRAIRHRLEHFGPIRLSDVEQARGELAAVAHRLAMSGKIEIPKRRRTAA